MILVVGATGSLGGRIARDPTEDSPVPFLAAKAQSEARLRASGMQWTILAPNAFQESWPGMVVGMTASMGHPVTLDALS